jgi:hypothetical protein
MQGAFWRKCLSGRANYLSHIPMIGERIERGRVYIAPPNFHLIIAEEGTMRVLQGPRENLHRPAIDPLFRSAAAAYGPRVIGVILTGMLDDGTAGLMVVSASGGIAVVQRPATALYASMPTSALDHVPNARVATLQEMPGSPSPANPRTVACRKKPPDEYPGRGQNGNRDSGARYERNFERGAFGPSLALRLSRLWRSALGN